MFSSKTAVFDRFLDKATSKLLLEPDWDSTLQICDNIRQGDVQPSYAIAAIRKKIENENPHVSKYALHVLESVVKNCGSIVHIEMATRDFMDFLKEQAKRPDPIKGKIVELVQVWYHAFRNEPGFKVVQETYNSMKSEGFTFPALKESDAMFLAEKAPEWRDGELCHRCRATFTTFNRKHHCRACGQVFCQKCSSKSSIIPKFGIEKEVRVCDTCYDQISKPTSSSEKKEEQLPAEYLSSSLAKQPQVPPARSEAEIQEEEELQLAIALSQSEAEAKENQRNKRISYNQPAATTATSSSSSHISSNNNPDVIYSQPMKQHQQQHQQQQQHIMDTSDMDPELARYLNRNYWQQKSFEMKNNAPNNTTTTNVATQPSAPVGVSSSSGGGGGGKKIEENGLTSDQMNNGNDDEKGESDLDRKEFLKALGSSIEIFVNRMKSNSQRGRSIANDSSVQTLFMTLNAMHPTLLKYISQQEDNRAHFESLQDKLSQLKDARDALDVLREEHREKTRRKQEEMERLRQIQLAQKLEVLRQKKQVYLEYQRQMALQRMHEQEMEMRKRLELQKQEQQMKAMQYAYPQQPQPMAYQQMAGGQVPYAVNQQMQAPPNAQQQPFVQQSYMGVAGGGAYAAATGAVAGGGAILQQQQLQQGTNVVAGYPQQNQQQQPYQQQPPQLPMQDYSSITTNTAAPLQQQQLQQQQLQNQQVAVPPPGHSMVGIPQQQQHYQQQLHMQQAGMNVVGSNHPQQTIYQQQQPQQQQPNMAAGFPAQHIGGVNLQQQQQLNYQQQTGVIQQQQQQQPNMSYPINYSTTTATTYVVADQQQLQQQQGNYYANQQQQPQHIPGPNEAELINFD